MSELAIEARGLSRRFGDLVAVDRIDLALPRAQIYGFLGPNGSGKTTTIRMLCGLLRRKIGYMTQRFSLYEELTVRENLDFMGEIYSLPAARRRQRVDALLADFHLARPDQRAGTLSGGQRQRLALAASLIHEPELLFLDEPTSAVDPQNRREFWESLFGLVDHGTTILVSTHYMDEAERCHALAILDDGALVAEGAPRELEARIGAVVLEIETEQMRGARAALAGVRGLWSVAQLGTRLHALIDPAVADPSAAVRATLSQSGVEASVEVAEASLEDVFVAATTERGAQP